MESHGGRTVMNDKDKHLAEQPESLAVKIKQAQEEAILTKATAQAYGLDAVKVEPAAAKTGEEAPSVVSVAMNQMNNMIKETTEMAKEKGTEVTQARKEADEARANLFTTQLSIIQEMHKSLMESQKQMVEQNSPEKSIATVEKWEGIISKFRPPPASEPSVHESKATTDQTTITLEGMRESHELAMEEIRGNREQANNEFKLRMVQFEEDTKRRWGEYKDGVKFKENAYSGFSDLAASIAAGIDKERGIQSPGEEGSIQATVEKFRCQLCGTGIDIPPGVEKVVCSKPECAAEYAIRSHQ